MGLFGVHEKNKEKYRKIRADKEKYKKYLEERRNYYRNMRKNNPFQYSFIQEKTKIRQIKNRELAKEMNLCPQCLRERDNPKFKLCSSCRKCHREYMKKINK